MGFLQALPLEVSTNNFSFNYFQFCLVIGITILFAASDVQTMQTWSTIAVTLAFPGYLESLPIFKQLLCNWIIIIQTIAKLSLAYTWIIINLEFTITDFWLDPGRHQNNLQLKNLLVAWIHELWSAALIWVAVLLECVYIRMFIYIHYIVYANKSSELNPMLLTLLRGFQERSRCKKVDGTSKGISILSSFFFSVGWGVKAFCGLISQKHIVL